MKSSSQAYVLTSVFVAALLALCAGGDGSAQQNFGPWGVDARGPRRLLVPSLRKTGGVEVHVGVEAGFAPARKAHPAFLRRATSTRPPYAWRGWGSPSTAPRSTRSRATAGCTPPTGTATAWSYWPVSDTAAAEPTVA